MAGGHRITIVIPARDEEATVGEVVEVVRRAWVEEVPLVDELIVIDSDSTDATCAVAAAAGATVHRAADVRPDLGPARGKGEALWKALQVSTGDVLAFLDADLIEWGPHFVPGLLGPLLTDPGAHLVKAVYHRPLLDEHGQEAETGGRVTELVARPLLALHWPELAGVIQPLSGEWAIRRADFEAMSVPVGYGVEIAALIDIATRHGASSIAQVDLGRRAHRHHRHDTLGPMAVQVLAAADRRLRSRELALAAETVPASAPARVAATAGVVLRQFDPVPGGYEPRSQTVDIAERPPAASVRQESA